MRGSRRQAIFQQMSILASALAIGAGEEGEQVEFRRVDASSTEAHAPDINLLVSSQRSTDGLLIESVSTAWLRIVQGILANEAELHQLDWRQVEELVAGALKQSGFNRVILTPPSNDFGRDVIAERFGVGGVRVLAQVKKYRPDRVVTRDEVKALLATVAFDQNASKGLFLTTSRFAPKLFDDPAIAAVGPNRLELLDGSALIDWLKKVAAPS